MRLLRRNGRLVKRNGRLVKKPCGSGCCGCQSRCCQDVPGAVCTDLGAGTNCAVRPTYSLTVTGEVAYTPGTFGVCGTVPVNESIACSRVAIASQSGPSQLSCDGLNGVNFGAPACSGPGWNLQGAAVWSLNSGVQPFPPGTPYPHSNGAAANVGPQYAEVVVSGTIACRGWLVRVVYELITGAVHWEGYIADESSTTFTELAVSGVSVPVSAGSCPAGLAFDATGRFDGTDGEVTSFQISVVVAVTNALRGCASGSGACCKPVGSCEELSPEECAAAGGEYRGGPCVDADCGNPRARGACCKPDGSCIVTSRSNCDAIGGTYRGNNSPCATANCPQPEVAACCLPDETCSPRTQFDCESAQGTWFPGQTCEEVDCVNEQRGGCCQFGGFCEILTRTECLAIPDAFYKGDNSTCDGSMPCAGACCQPDGQGGRYCADNNTPQICAAVGGIFLGIGTFCDPDPCGNFQGSGVFL